MRRRYLIKILFSFIVYYSLLIANCYGQSITWQKIYRNPLSNDAEGWDICSADGNNFYIAGFVAPILPYLYILKINQYGDTIWTRILGYGGQGYAVTPSGDGGCVLTGQYGGAFALKMNFTGDTIWSRHYSGKAAYDIKRTSDGGYILCGIKVSGSNFKGYICKTDSLGHPEWEKEYFDGYTTDFFAIEESIDGNGYVVGGQRFSSNGKLCAYLAKIDNLGNLVWDRKFSVGIGFTYCQSFTHKNSGFILTGSASIHSSPDSSRVYVLKTDIYGNFISSKIFSSSNYQDRSVIAKDNNNKFYVSLNSRTNSQLTGSKVMSMDSSVMST